MKQTHTHVWSLAGEEAVSYSLARGKALGRVDTMRGARALKITNY